MDTPTKRRWFLGPFDSQEAAQDSHEWNLFDPQGVFLTADGGYVTGKLQCNALWSAEWLATMAAQIEGMTGYKLVSYCDPIVPGWNRWPAEPTPAASEQAGGAEEGAG